MLDYFQQNPTVFIGYIFVLGIIVGSFLNVVIYRLPIMMKNSWHSQCEELLAPEEDPPPQANQDKSSEAFNLVVPRSRCPHCKHLIGAVENIPIFSFAFQKGKCKHCQVPIAWRYPIVELITGLCSVLVAWQFGFSLETMAALFFTWALIVLTVIDFDHQLLPDSITLPLLWLGILLAFDNTFTDLPSSVIGAIAGYLSLWSIYWGFKLLTKKEGMGYGDFKLLAALGAWLGWQMLPIVILLSSLVGAVVGITLIVVRGRDRNIPIPFGPYLATAGWIALFWGEDITQLYLQWAKLTG